MLFHSHITKLNLPKNGTAEWAKVRRDNAVHLNFFKFIYVFFMSFGNSYATNTLTNSPFLGNIARVDASQLIISIAVSK